MTKNEGLFLKCAGLLLGYTASDGRIPVSDRLVAAFFSLHQAPSLKMLALYFDVYYTGRHQTGKAYSHQSAIVYALGRNKYHLPKLQSLKIHGLLDSCEPGFISLFDKAPITRLIASLRHLDFSLPCGTTGLLDSKLQELFWKQVVVRHVLQPAVNLESLAITRRGSCDEAQCLDISQAQLATYPRLAALLLTEIVWEDGTIGQGDIVTPSPLEDFIVRHRKTLKKLELHNCTINVKDYGRRPPVCYWADVYKRLANALTELVELKVYNFEVPYLSSTGPSARPLLPLPYYDLKRLEGMERDAEALKEFEAVVKNRDGR
jgi:hypothetical protein